MCKRRRQWRRRVRFRSSSHYLVSAAPSAFATKLIGASVGRSLGPCYAEPVIFEPLTREYGGYIFDCDGTLADSMVVHHRAWLAALAAHGAVFDFNWELFTSRAGMTLPNTVRELNAQFGLRLDPEGVTAAQREEYERFLHTVQPIAEVVELARRVAVSRPVSVASGGERQVVRRTLESEAGT